ncbi:MAG: DUF423 domain-containing protein [Bacteroidota bacterium]
MRIFFLRTALAAAFLAVVLGAFAAHALENLIAAPRIEIFETGVRYQFYHSFALLFLALLYDHLPANWLNWAGRFFLIGIFGFSGSLYLLALRDVLGIAHWWWLGPITPIGGTLFIVGWAVLFLSTWRR